MSTMTLNKLVEKLSPDCRKSLEAAVAICNSRSHFTVELEHWLLAMIEQQLDDVRLIFGSFDIDIDQVKQDLNQSLESFKTGSDSSPSLSVHVTTLLRQSWLSTSIEFTDEQIRSAYVIYTLTKDDTLSSLVTRCSKLFNNIEPGQLLHAWPEIVAQSQERNTANVTAATPANGSSKTPSLDQFTVDLTAQAKAGKIDPILGRDFEIRQMVDILTRRRQNNPILTGEAGVGKTAVVEGLALRIAQKDVPAVLQNVKLHSLDLALLQAGAGMKGEFENRLKSLINEVKNAVDPVILFIDEAHTMIGSGGQAGQNDAANLLKPALARGELRTIAATTWAEYKKFFEKDAALTRRFQVVKVEEPTPEKAVAMLRGLVPVMEKHHKVFISEQALESAVHLSHRYITARQLPDKAVALLDTACARVAMSQASTPNAIEQLMNRLSEIEAQVLMLNREQKTGLDHSEQLSALKSELVEIEQQLEPLNEQFNVEKGIVAELNQALESINTNDADSSAEVLEQLKESKLKLASYEHNMVHWQVDEELIAQVISDWTGIPVGKMHEDEIHGILNLAAQMKQRVVGQDHALELMAKVVQTSRAQLADESRPNGIFMLAGPSGVGKTETALSLAQEVYGSEDNVTVINMSEFKEEHKVSLLLGSPPGYVGYGEGGILTEAVRRKPYSVVLLDEMEKAHPGVQDIFYQVFDKGTIKDGEGRDIDFKNTIIIMTSNVGTDTTMSLFEDEESKPSIKGLLKALQDDLLGAFKPAFLGRINVIPYIPLSDEILTQIAALQISKIIKRVKKHYDAQLTYNDDVIEHIIANCQNAGSGARNIHTILQNKVLPLLSEILLSSMVEGEKVTSISLLIKDNEFDVELTKVNSK
ncbi:MAG: type VI secretion system protein VasG [Pseudoalteromonas tetraodonis]|jgi:type VI secretion system protein VasG|uniref:ClpV1 family T6SS ATPase n=1 Tax=Pseudoalteromonas tetraodonis GFC TaxID=1315271 RepID=A0AA37W5J7_9GAMM|nr:MULTISPECIES: type VI secretion system ATPase TssH [Pseudoalteromonas]PHQ91720.1 MAG: type VI secretion system ATPase TssH [Pseudoalteromonas sp.]ADT70259.1 ATPase [Pseudoalteromonas sp. SM9913]ATD04978.1 type VI secretion system protein VasG [Pseudoalteromonas tetraodonis]MDN3435803.1 type VI secretion system ATPase TssH [Pseudoalteromonas sp. APC 3356]GEN38005.1 ClpV1 family T6SS ATPase [Pseudoalteromonas tetraodonis GFC]